MAATSSIIGWYGPLIDLSNASAHIDDFVQLLAFVHSSQPHQKDNASNSGGALLKTNIQVGDDTRSFFSVSIWQKHMGSAIVAGDIILLQNVKIVKYRNVLEAAAIQISSLLVLVHSYEFAAPKDIHELAAHGQLGETAKAKLRRVVNWVQHTESALQHVQKVDACQLYVWDQGGQIPLLVMNKAAEILFGNITAENVYECYQEGESRRHDIKHHSNLSSDHNPKARGSNGLTSENRNLGSMQAGCSHHRIKPDFYSIWLILLKTLLQHGKNSAFRFEIIVDRDKDIENGRFELVSLTMPCYESDKF